MTEQPGDTCVYVVVFVSADRHDMGGGTHVCWSEDEALDHIRKEVANQIEGRWDDSEWATQQEADAAFEQTMEDLKRLDLDALRKEYQNDAGDDYIQDCWIEKHTLSRPPDVSSPEKIEQFLEN